MPSDDLGLASLCCLLSPRAGLLCGLCPGLPQSVGQGRLAVLKIVGCLESTEGSFPSSFLFLFLFREL